MFYQKASPVVFPVFFLPYMIQDIKLFRAIVHFYTFELWCFSFRRILLTLHNKCLYFCDLAWVSCFYKILNLNEWNQLKYLEFQWFNCYLSSTYYNCVRFYLYLQRTPTLSPKFIIWIPNFDLPVPCERASEPFLPVDSQLFSRTHI